METLSKTQYLKLAASLAVFAYAAHCMADKGNWHLIDSIDLIIHEAGHTLFSLFGWVLYVAGGSLLQILVPLMFFVSFFRQEQLFSSAIMLYWAAISTANVAVYAGDAVFRKLPLITGDSEGHDWNNLLSHFGMLRHAAFIAGAIFAVAILFLCAGVLMSVYATYKKTFMPGSDVQYSSDNIRV